MTQPPVPGSGIGVSELRELLLASERSRELAEGSLTQARAVLTGLEIVATARDENELFSGIVEVVGELVPFDDAAVIIDRGEGRTIGVVAATNAELQLQELVPGAFLNRVMSGKPAIVTNLALVPEWSPVTAAHPDLLEPADSVEATGSAGSALFVPLRAKELRAAFVCLADGAASYTSHHLEVLQYLAPLAGQALQRYHDMNELGSLIDRLEYLAHHDGLTGLGNRSMFSAKLDQAAGRLESDGEPIALVHIDLDEFKMVNDNFGHQVGDTLLKEVANRISLATREVDAVVRLGGDEFAVLASGDTVDWIEAITKRILDSINQPLEIEGHIIRPNASAGICVCPRDEGDPTSLLSSADLALYDAKMAGGGRHSVFSTSLRDGRDRERAVEADVRRALAERELVLWYQPIVAAIDGDASNPIALEALIRWQHPERGLIPPVEFLPIATRSNLIIEIDEYVLERALDDLEPWLRGDSARRICLNLSAKQLLVADYGKQIQAALGQRGIRSSSLELELSEEIVARRTLDTMIENLGMLRDLGVGLAFDDFGTGYSSVLQLRRFPGHRLKIDRQFVDSMCDNSADLAVVRGMIDMAHGLDLTVVAEGIENEAQRLALVKLGCDEVQGYHLARPGPLDQILSPALLAGEVVTSALSPST